MHSNSYQYHLINYLGLLLWLVKNGLIFVGIFTGFFLEQKILVAFNFNFTYGVHPCSTIVIKPIISITIRWTGHGIIKPTCSRWVSVVEFHDRALGIGKVFGQKSTVVKWNYQILGRHQVTVRQKLGVILVIKRFWNWSQQKMLFTKKVRLNWYSSMKDSDDFWHRKFTLKVQKLALFDKLSPDGDSKSRCT